MFLFASFHFLIYCRRSYVFMSAHFSAASDSLVGVMFPDFVSLSHAEVSVSTTPLAALLVRTDERDQFFGDVTMGVVSFSVSNSNEPLLMREESVV